MTQDRPASLAPFTVPNTITLARIVAVPVLAWLMLGGQWQAAFWLFVIAGISDAVDGILARLFNQSSVLGAWLDPVADKALLVTGLVSLAVLSLVPVWLVVLAVLRDVLILAGVGVALVLGKGLTIRPMMVSKATTFLQIALVALVMGAHAFDFEPGILKPLLVWATAALTLASFATYGVVFVRHMGQGGYSR